MKISDPVVAVCGATGVVGNEMIEILLERKFPYSVLRLFASANSAGEIYRVGDDEVIVEELNEKSFEGIDIALFATSGELSAKYVPCAVEAGAIAIDNSSYYRMDPEIPLIVPEVNAEAIGKSNIIANPNCSTIQLMPVLHAIEKRVGLKRVVVSTYQAVSGAGKAAIDELLAGVQAIMTQKPFEPQAFPCQIAFNCIPHIDVFLEDGYTKEEAKVMNESRKILGLPELAITCTAVRVPVFNSHAESVNIETKEKISASELTELLEATEGVRAFADPLQYPMQISVSGQDDVFVGRIREDKSVENGINLWVVGDNLRKGAALNAVQIAELFLDD